MGLNCANLRLFTYPYQSKELILKVTAHFLTWWSFRNWLIMLLGIKNTKQLFFTLEITLLIKFLKNVHNIKRMF